MGFMARFLAVFPGKVELHQVYANSKFAIERNFHSFSCFVTRAFLGQEALDKIANSVF
jgi:hypothetical protein